MKKLTKVSIKFINILLFDNNYLDKYSYNFSKILFIYLYLINLNIQFNKFNNLFVIFH